MHENIAFQLSQKLKKAEIPGTFFKVTPGTIHIQKIKHIQ